MSQSLLTIKNLEVKIVPRLNKKPIFPVRKLNLNIEKGKTLALVGESGCGKSMTCLAISGLLPKRAEISKGKIVLSGKNILKMKRKKAREFRKKRLSMIFQDATNSLNPVHSIGWQVAEAIKLRSEVKWTEAIEEAESLLSLVGMPNPKRALKAYPHEFSGGMNQRAMIALAMAGNPKLLIADEATTALDVTIQSQILDLLYSLQEKFQMSILFVTHDLGIVAEIADTVTVMYAGCVVESGPTNDVFDAPIHPYTKSLLSSLPRMDRVSHRLSVIPGVVPAIDDMPAGCSFDPRCNHSMPCCSDSFPEISVNNHRSFACFNPIGHTPVSS